MTDQMALPRVPATPVQDQGDHDLLAGPDGILHAFAPRNGIRWSVCDRRDLGHAGIRWTAALTPEGDTACRTCVALLRDDLRAIVVVLARMGIRVDLGSATPAGDQRGNHYAGMDEAGS